MNAVNENVFLSKNFARAVVAGWIKSNFCGAAALRNWLYEAHHPRLDPENATGISSALIRKLRTDAHIFHCDRRRFSQSFKQDVRFSQTSRRPFLLTLIAVFYFTPYKLIAEVPDLGKKVVNFQWTVPAGLSNKAVDSLGAKVTTRTHEGRGAFVVIIGAVALVYLARSILQLRDELEGGVSIDVRNDEIIIKRNIDLPGGTILLISDEGAKLHNREEISQPTELLKEMVK